jgi:chloramphenicol O-acetyltransferase
MKLYGIDSQKSTITELTVKEEIMNFVDNPAQLSYVAFAEKAIKDVK